MKLYKYRPLSDLLFKELYYQELYFASYNELNDPLDLTTRIDFRTKYKLQIEYLTLFLIQISLKEIHHSNQVYIDKLRRLLKEEEINKSFSKKLYNSIKKTQSDKDFLTIDTVKELILNISSDLNLNLDLIKFKEEINRLTNIFFERSYATCFTETFNNYLMWSHYTSNHTGICLEFTLERENQFPFISRLSRKPNKEIFLEKHSEWALKEYIHWETVWKIKYHQNSPTINFYDFLPVFNNEGNCDLMGLSKSRWHGYADELERIFSIKTKPWEYEKEWRVIEINFSEIMEPEARIRHFPIEVLTGIYFGIQTPAHIKKRIHNILNDRSDAITFFDGQLTSDMEIIFKKCSNFE